MMAFLLSHRARNGENFTGDLESPTVSVLRVRDMASCRDFVSFSLKSEGINSKSYCESNQIGKAPCLRHVKVLFACFSVEGVRFGSIGVEMDENLNQFPPRLLINK